MNVYDSIFTLAPSLTGHSVLNIGFNCVIPKPKGGGIEGKKWWIDLFKKHGFSRFVILEIFPSNVEFSKKYFRDRNVGVEVILGDVLRATEYFNYKKFDVSLWWHGPEHVRLDEIDICLAKLEFVTKKAIIIGCPALGSKQGIVYDNPHEKHISKPGEAFFKERGFMTMVVRGTHPKNHLTAIKVVET